MIRHVWFDPGETTGWAVFENEYPRQMGELKYPQDLLLLEGIIAESDVLGYENYTITPKGAIRNSYTPSWSEVLPIRVIGAIELASMITNVNREIVSQPRDRKPAGYGFAGLTYVKGKKRVHMHDAVAHGAYWWMMTGRKRDAQ